MRAVIACAFLAACGAPGPLPALSASKEQALDACEVAAPAYGNSVAACLVILERWKATDAALVRGWLGQERALASRYDEHTVREYLNVSRGELAGVLGLDTGWVSHRMTGDSILAADWRAADSASNVAQRNSEVKGCVADYADSLVVAACLMETFGWNNRAAHAAAFAAIRRLGRGP